MNVVFLLTHVPNPRINKRIAVAKEIGSVSVLCTRRTSQNNYEPYHLDIRHIIMDIDLPSSMRLLKRYLVSRTYKKEALKYLKKLKPNIIYTTGLDSLIIANRYRLIDPNVRIFYEVADLRELYIVKPKTLLKKLTAAMISFVEKKNFISVEHLIVTSMKFYDVHYHKLIDRERVLFMPNIPDFSVFSAYQPKKQGRFTVGFIGGIRYLQQMKMLVDAAEKTGSYVLFAGAGGTADDYQQITDYCKNKPFVSFTGKYNYNKDIARLYGLVDCVYAVYDADNPNVRIALPNKLYESIYCELPIIVAKGTYLSKHVVDWEVGTEVSHNDLTDLIKVLIKLSGDKEYRDTFTRNCALLKDTISDKQYNLLLKKVLTNRQI